MQFLVVLLERGDLHVCTTQFFGAQTVVVVFVHVAAAVIVVSVAVFIEDVVIAVQFK